MGSTPQDSLQAPPGASSLTAPAPAVGSSTITSVPSPSSLRISIEPPRSVTVRWHSASLGTVAQNPHRALPNTRRHSQPARPAQLDGPTQDRHVLPGQRHFSAGGMDYDLIVEGEPEAVVTMVRVVRL